MMLSGHSHTAVQATSPMVFPSTRTGERAVQTVEVMAQPSASHAMTKTAHTFTFCLEHITQGPYKVIPWPQACYADALLSGQLT